MLSVGFYKAQGNLQFNQVKMVFAQETVPVGKVWKIESVIYSVSVGSVSSSLTQDDQIKIDGATYHDLNFSLEVNKNRMLMNNGASYIAYRQTKKIKDYFLFQKI
jgi:hypothetical protein